jgi:hypothetical protein
LYRRSNTGETIFRRPSSVTPPHVETTICGRACPRAMIVGPPVRAPPSAAAAAARPVHPSNWRRV